MLSCGGDGLVVFCGLVTVEYTFVVYWAYYWNLWLLCSNVISSVVSPRIGFSFLSLYA